MNINSTNTDGLEIPPFQGDYAKAVFLSRYEKYFQLHDDNKYALYFTYECGITDVNKYHAALFKEGYVIDAPMYKCYEVYTIDELKSLLDELGEIKKGNKGELINRIINNSNMKFVQENCPKNVFVLTEKGTSFVSEHEDYIKLHKYLPEYVSEFINNYNEKNSFYDTVEKIISEWMNSNKKNLVSYGYRKLSKAYADDNDREHSLEMLLRMIYVDLNGITGHAYISLYIDHAYGEEKLKELFSDIVRLNTDDILSIDKYKDIYNDSIVHNIYKQELPIHICDEQLFIYIINSILDGTYNEDVVQNKLKKAFNKMIEELFQNRTSLTSQSTESNENIIKTPWYKKAGWIIASLILLYPLGLFLMWKYTDWALKTKKIASIAFGIWYVLALIIGL